MDLSLFHLPAWRDVYGITLTQFFEELVDEYKLADRLGWARGICTEHHFHYYGGAIPNPAVILTAAARETKNLRLGAAVSLMQLRDPLQVAEDYAMLDQLSGGRCDFGVARGFVPHEFAAFHVEQKDAGERIAEGLDICQRFWAGRTFEHRGKHFNFDKVEPWPPAVKGSLPIWNAASNTKNSFINAARRGFRLMMNQYPMSFASLKEKFGWYCEAWEQSGRPPGERKAMVSFMTHIAPTEEQAIEEALGALGDHVSAFVKLARGEHWDRNFEDGPQALKQMAAGQDIREMLRERTLICSPAQAAERIARYRDLGFTEVSFIARFTRLTHAQTVATMQRISNEVMPLLK